MKHLVSSGFLLFWFKFLLVRWLGLADVFECDFLLTEWACRVVFKPILDTALVEIVLYIAGENHYLLMRLELAQANAALVLIC